MSRNNTRNEGNILGALAAGSLIMFAIGGWFHNWSHNERGLWWPWQYKMSLLAGLANVWYIFLWAVGVTVVVAVILIWKRVPRGGNPVAMFVGGLLRSAAAGVFEEIVFRWLLVLSAPAILTLLNWITFGLVKWINVHWMLTFANWATFGILGPQLHNSNWVMAAAILYAAAAFSSGHAYLGPVGLVNSWFIGMIMFYLVFNYGIITAIVAHFAYDAIIFSILAASAAFRPKMNMFGAMAALFRG